LHSAFGLEIPVTLEELLHPKRSALIVYDMQVGIVTQLKDGDDMVARVKEVLTAARRAGLRIFHTRHLSLPREMMGVSQYRMAMAWQRVDDPAKVQPWFLRDAPGFQIVPELKPLESEAVLDKITMSAFEGTPLSIALRDCGIQSFAIAGVALEIGIDPTCRHGADLGLVPILIRDACGSGDAAAGERSAESLRFLGDTVITDRKTVCGVLGSYAGS
jgi:nicotinamidase-related amidase